MQTVLFTDLDDTLFVSKRKAPPAPDYQAAAFLADGSPISYASPVQQQWLAHWRQHALVVPVTARNHDSFRRVALPFDSHAVIDYGAVILNPDGTPDEAWLDNSRRAASGCLPRWDDLQQTLFRQPESADWNIRLIADYGIACYLLVKAKSGEGSLKAAADVLRGKLRDGEKLHWNGNNLALLPPWLDKAHAVRRLQEQYRRRYGTILSIGMGDSLIDTAFMRCCDYLIAPAASQIAAALGEMP